MSEFKWPPLTGAIEGSGISGRIPLWESSTELGSSPLICTDTELSPNEADLVSLGRPIDGEARPFNIAHMRSLRLYNSSDVLGSVLSIPSGLKIQAATVDLRNLADSDYSGLSAGTIQLYSTGNNGLVLNGLGSGISIKEGADCRMGSGTLVAGTVTINTTQAKTGDRIFVTATSSGVNSGVLAVTAIVNNTSFTVTSSNALDTATFNWIIFRPVP